MKNRITFFRAALFTAIFSLIFTSCDNPLFIKATTLYKVSFSTNGGTPIEEMYTKVISKNPVTTKTDCDFEGWFTTSDFSGEKINFPFEVTENITLYAKWKQKYRVNFQTFGESEIEPQTVSILLETQTPYKDNCDFSGWYATSDFSGNPIDLPYTVTKPTTLYAKYLQRYTLSFETNGGNSLDDMSVAIIKTLPVPTRTNYDFDGWYLSPNLSGTALQVPYAVTQNTVLYAKWLPTYLVSFEVDGGSEVPSFRAREAESVQSPEKSGYTFIEWYFDSAFTRKVNFPIVLTEDTTLYAYYRQNHTVYFESNGGSAINPVSNYLFEELPEPELKDKTFMGWYTSPELNEESRVLTPFEPSENTTLYAKWVTEMWKITYDANGATGGTVPDAVMVEKGSSFTVSANTGNLVKTGLAFTKWSTSRDGTSGQTYTAGQTITPGTSMTLYAQWGKNYGEMVTVEGGWFYLGDPNSGSERPKITLSSFQIAKYELTYELWLEVYTWAKDNGYNMTAASKGYAANDAYKDFVPATNISWNMACVFCNAYSAYKGLEPVYYRGNSIWKDDTSTSGTFRWDRTKNGYRLPTECEWEFAAGGGNAETHDQYMYAGSNNVGEVAWYYSNSGKEAHPVGTKKANTLGIYDMCGNALEFCFDEYSDYGSGELTNPIHYSGEYQKRVFRGGCFYYTDSTSITNRKVFDIATVISYKDYRDRYISLRIARNTE